MRQVILAGLPVFAGLRIVPLKLLISSLTATATPLYLLDLHFMIKGYVRRAHGFGSRLVVIVLKIVLTATSAQRQMQRNGLGRGSLSDGCFQGRDPRQAEYFESERNGLQRLKPRCMQWMPEAAMLQGGRTTSCQQKENHGLHGPHPSAGRLIWLIQIGLFMLTALPQPQRMEFHSHDVMPHDACTLAVTRTVFLS
jgi:hypothetical protein